MTRRKSVHRGLPSHFLSGISGTINAHSLFRRSLAYSRSSRQYCRTGDFSLGYRDLIRLSQTHKSQPAEITQLIFGQTLRPKHSNRRIVAQNGAFIIFGLNRKLSIGNDPSRFNTVTLSVDQKSKDPILKQLGSIEFNDEAIIP